MQSAIKSRNTINQFQDAYFESRRCYTEYFLTYPKAASEDFSELEDELLNLQQAFHWALEGDENKLVPEFWDDIKDFLWDHGHWQIFIDWGESTLKILEQTNAPVTKAWVLSELGWFWMEQSEFDMAQKMFERSRNIFIDLDHLKGLCAVDRYLGVLAYRIGDFSKASICYEVALQLAAAEGYVGMIAEIRNLQGSLARKMGDFAQARQFYEEARKEIEELGDKWRLTAVLRNLAHLDFQFGNLLAAKNGFVKAIHSCEQIDRKDMLYGCQLGLAEVEERLGNFQEARKLAIAARHGFAKLGMKRDLEEANQFLNKLHD